MLWYQPGEGGWLCAISLTRRSYQRRCPQPKRLKRGESDVIGDGLAEMSKWLKLFVGRASLTGKADDIEVTFIITAIIKRDKASSVSRSRQGRST